MSEQNKTNLPDPTTAFNTLATKVANSVFFHKCAAAALVPRTEEEAQAMLSCSYKLAALAENASVKAAAATSNPFLSLDKAADGLMDRFGLSQQKAAAAHANECREVSRHFAADPEIYNSVLSLKAADAQRASAA